jgi:large subunit ribosomal protein L4
LATAKLGGKKNLIVIDEVDQNLLLAARNIPTVLVQRVWDLNTYNLLNADNVIFTDAAVKALTAPDKSKA